jgi:hypothetical protein
MNGTTEMNKQVVYTWDEMVELDCLFECLKVAHVVYSPATLADILAANAPRIVQPEKMPAFEAGLAKLRQEPEEKLTAWLAKRADWFRRGDDELELSWVEEG